MPDLARRRDRQSLYAASGQFVCTSIMWPQPLPMPHEAMLCVRVYLGSPNV
jgi:hypothetical protein